MIGTIILVALLGGVTMARRGRPKRRAMGRYIRGNVNEQLAIGTLASKTLTVDAFDSVVKERTWISSVRAAWSVNNWTPTATVGPLLIGIAHGDYSAAEIEEWIENTGTWDEGDLVQQEVGKRKIRIVGQLSAPASAGEDTVLNDGRQTTTKCGWILNAGQTLDIWAYNLGLAAFATTAPILHADGHANLWPR